jgi:hypothetical protein
MENTKRLFWEANGTITAPGYLSPPELLNKPARHGISLVPPEFQED